MSPASGSPLSPNPPPSGEPAVNWLRLIRSRRVGPATFHRLFAEHGSVAAALDALPEIARQSGVRNYAVCPIEVAEAELEHGTRQGYRLLKFSDPDYPTLLAGIADAPPVLWVLGKSDLLNNPCVAIVGSRNASSLGKRMTRAIVHGLGDAGYTVVSGLARGIDAAAHEAALETGTAAVQASGLDVCYPRETTDLHHKIAEHGIRLSEQPPGLHPQARHFPQRNRIIAALSLATVVVEGAARSGSLITAREAADLGRDVMAVPGNPLDARATGCNQLIRDGAVLVRSAADIIEGLQVSALPLPDVKDPKPTVEPVPRITGSILDIMGPNAVSEDVGGILKGASFHDRPTQRRMRLASVVAGLGMAYCSRVPLRLRMEI